MLICISPLSKNTPNNTERISVADKFVLHFNFTFLKRWDVFSLKHVVNINNFADRSFTQLYRINQSFGGHTTPNWLQVEHTVCERTPHVRRGEARPLVSLTNKRLKSGKSRTTFTLCNIGDALCFETIIRTLALHNRTKKSALVPKFRSLF